MAGDARFSDGQLQGFYEEFVIMKNALQTHIDDEDERTKVILDAQLENTQVLHGLVETVNAQHKDTKEMVDAWKNIKGAIWIADKVGVVGMWLLKLTGFLAVGTTAAWAWLKDWT